VELSVREAKINAWIDEGKRNLAEFRRSPFHEELRTDVRDHYTGLIENFQTETLAKVRELLLEAKIKAPLPPSMSASRTLEGCWELKTHKNPQTITINGFPEHGSKQPIRDLVYRFVPIVLNAELMGEREVVRHLCHNRACVCPDHLVIGTYQQNTQDEAERVYAGRDSKGKGQKI
tara:strand:+ start:925 stop:1452 length:528 start_codon:yes stop_codon:yes gene_type:complete